MRLQIFFKREAVLNIMILAVPEWDMAAAIRYTCCAIILPAI
jgi:hypothetical protein